MFEMGLPKDEAVRMACLEQAVMWSEPITPADAVVSAAEKFEAFVKGGSNEE